LRPGGIRAAASDSADRTSYESWPVSATACSGLSAAAADEVEGWPQGENGALALIQISSNREKRRRRATPAPLRGRAPGGAFSGAGANARNRRAPLRGPWPRRRASRSRSRHGPLSARGRRDFLEVSCAPRRSPCVLGLIFAFSGCRSHSRRGTLRPLGLSAQFPRPYARDRPGHRAAVLALLCRRSGSAIASELARRRQPAG
jgi:hypothetical protein